MKTVTFTVQHKNVQAFQQLESSLLMIEGVERALIDVGDGDIKVEYNEDTTNVSAVIDTIERAGTEIKEVLY
ncbi:hypothetical protein [Metabacillus malikii]|uniref:Copper chaperone n=1 Tax=Metabacillus malikii TaxID=1504265 RepID=A0ABT9ZDX1_9BACI|nr:hypothetical protein [Metabacillus malikii]MDQ0230047.1 copper chaperone [Metabacillus malikii]